MGTKVVTLRSNLAEEGTGDFSFVGFTVNDYSSKKDLDITIDMTMFDNSFAANKMYTIVTEKEFDHVYKHLLDLRDNISNVLDIMTDTFMDYKIRSTGEQDEEEDEEEENYFK